MMLTCLGENNHQIENQFRSTSIHLEIVGYLDFISCKDVGRHLQCDKMNEKYNSIVKNSQGVQSSVHVEIQL